MRESKMEGKVEGEREAKLQTAREALRLGADIDFVGKITGLDKKTLQELEKELHN